MQPTPQEQISVELILKTVQYILEDTSSRKLTLENFAVMSTDMTVLCEVIAQATGRELREVLLAGGFSEDFADFTVAQVEEWKSLGVEDPNWPLNEESQNAQSND